MGFESTPCQSVRSLCLVLLLAIAGANCDGTIDQPNKQVAFTQSAGATYSGVAAYNPVSTRIENETRQRTAGSHGNHAKSVKVTCENGDPLRRRVPVILRCHWTGIST
ncbi:hypothetical protein B0H17DRAFT_1127254 [Mycena rosella]|uniref:Secreted protein n=1 Tax=Mycena rosella TaxID=1033263 RepID=A0AAD7GQM9_MYCRO|nr:hypothetical protein B0H17DRAFT_1127254 [Mycena rosella]